MLIVCFLLIALCGVGAGCCRYLIAALEHDLRKGRFGTALSRINTAITAGEVRN